MKYIDKYPNSKPDDEVEPSILRVEKEHRCDVCRSKTYFIDIDYQVPVCSEECDDHINEEVFKWCSSHGE